MKNCKKKKYLVLIFTILIICAFGLIMSLCACDGPDESVPEPKKQTIQIVEVYEQFQNEPLAIEVKIDGGYIGNFTINDKEQIKEIYSIVINQEYVLCEGLYPPGSDNDIRFVFDSDSEITISTRYIYYLGDIYLAANSFDLDSMLITIGREKDALSER